MVKYLRIAVTVLSLTACVLLIALWVRSYSWTDVVRGRYLPTRAFSLNSLVGRVQLYEAGQPAPEPTYFFFKSVRTDTDDMYRTSAVLDVSQRPSRLHALGFYFGHFPSVTEIIVPTWFFVVSAATIAAVPWVGRNLRFSLRTLLIATTLIAVVLGLAFALNR